MAKNSNTRLAYSTDGDNTCPTCGKRRDRCTCGRRKKQSVGDGDVRVRREKKGRRGKTVTTISGLPLDAPALRELATDLKRRCGSGGSVKEGVVEIQGDHAELLVAELQKLGYAAKRAGG